MKGIAVLIAFLVVAGLAIWIGIEMRHDPGYVMVAYKGWSIETSFWITIAAALIVFVAVYLLIWTIGVTIRLPSNLRKWRGSKSERKAVQLTNLGLCELAEGRWQRAENSLIRGTRHNDATFINYIAAARAAHAQQEYQRRDEYLRKAYKQVRGSRIAIGLTQAQLEISSKQWEKAQKTLTQLHKDAPKHPFIIELLTRLHMQQQNWGQLRDLLPHIKRFQVLEQNVIEGLESTLFGAELTQASEKEDPNQLNNTWKKMPRAWRQDEDMKNHYIQCLFKQDRHLEALPEIESLLKQKWNSSLVHHYGHILGENLNKQLSLAESWIKKHDQDHAIYLTCGRLCCHLELWGKAKDYLEKSIKIHPSTDAYQLLGHVFEKENEEALAMECYRKGLELSTKASGHLAADAQNKK